MKDFQLVLKSVYRLEGEEYLIEVFSRSDGSHFARTAFSPKDVIISDGVSLEEVLLNHQELLPLAVRSRQMHFPPRSIN